jgi:UDP-N-acetylglucosamine 2-epimerase
MPYKQFLEAQYHAAFLISDSGTAQEEPALFKTPVVVPRDFTERPQSMDNKCSVMIDVNTAANDTWASSRDWIKSGPKINSSWLGTGETAEKVMKSLKAILEK